MTFAIIEAAARIVPCTRTFFAVESPIFFPFCVDKLLPSSTVYTQNPLRRTGIAVSDPTGTIASPVEVIRRVGWGPDVRKIREICDHYETDRILSGLPLNMDGSEGFQAGKVRDFCRRLEAAGLSVTFQDERLSTVSAEEALLEGGMSRQDRKQTVDKIAAAVILQQWLDSNVR